jgi:hypothetical protein
MFVEEKNSGTEDNPSFSICCSNKQFCLPTLPALPPLILSLIQQTNQRGKHFVEQIRSYNSVFAFSSFNVKVFVLGLHPILYFKLKFK